MAGVVFPQTVLGETTKENQDPKSSKKMKIIGDSLVNCGVDKEPCTSNSGYKLVNTRDEGYLSYPFYPSPENECHCHSSEVAEMLLHSSISKQTIRTFKYDNLKRYLIGLAELDKPSEKFKVYLIRKLFEKISFKENACARGKLQAVVAGSYPAFLSRKVKKYSDVDIFLLWNSYDQRLAEHQKTILFLLKHLQSPSEEDDACYYYGVSIDGIKTVVNVGRLQFIVKTYDYDCYCSYHVDSIFFEAFHHVTRWKFLVFTVKNDGTKYDSVISKYIPYKEQLGVVAKRIVIYENEPKYPSKHMNNRLDLGPPSLYQQALRASMKCEKESRAFIEMANTTY